MTEDRVNAPHHYTLGSVECIEAIESVVQGLEGTDAFLTGQVMKYIWRWKHKNGLEDLKKAEWYLGRLIDSNRFTMPAVTKPDSPAALEKPTPPIPNFTIKRRVYVGDPREPTTTSGPFYIAGVAGGHQK